MHETSFAVPSDHPAFAGHFPGRAILPGVIILGWAIDAVARLTGRPAEGWEVSSAKFLRPVAPGAILVLRHTEQTAGRWRFDALTDGEPVATGVLRIGTGQP